MMNRREWWRVVAGALSLPYLPPLPAEEVARVATLPESWGYLDRSLVGSVSFRESVLDCLVDTAPMETPFLSLAREWGSLTEAERQIFSS